MPIVFLLTHMTAECLLAQSSDIDVMTISAHELHNFILRLDLARNFIYHSYDFRFGKIAHEYRRLLVYEVLLEQFLVNFRSVRGNVIAYDDENLTTLSIRTA